MLTIDHKRGDYFAYATAVTLPAGTWTAASQGRLKGKDDSEEPDIVFTVTLTPPVAPETDHVLLLEATAEQMTLELGTYFCDVQFKDTDQKPTSSETFAIALLRDITHD